ncbi:MAG: AbrB/MazE/SpoVT family DNA-binding domain-containing protein [Promethearchaeota archaeon]|nr:MAG: AbrB/MazE/SpoVT family DNA-binding domain-containing protein [Candidatus Lokiarchaeota archaeon]
MEIKHRKLSTKGQLSIPKRFREMLNLHAGDEVILILKDDGIVIKPKVSHIGMLRGLLSEEIDLEKAKAFIEKERKEWRI